MTKKMCGTIGSLILLICLVMVMIIGGRFDALDAQHATASIAEIIWEFVVLPIAGLIGIGLVKVSE